MSMTIDIANTVARFFRAVDDRDWATAEALMSDPVHLDYSSFGAGDAADLPPQTILAGWQGLLPGFDHTHHQICSLDVTVAGDRATVGCYGTATHVIAEADGGQVWTVVGRYTLTLQNRKGWQLTGIVFHFKYQDGNTGLPALASARVASAQSLGAQQTG